VLARNWSDCTAHVHARRFRCSDERKRYVIRMVTTSYERKQDSEKQIRFPNYSQTGSSHSCNLYEVEIAQKNDNDTQYIHVWT
jgi:hypothetical protein